MPYAVVQETMDVPDVDNLVRAVSQVPYLTDTDAKLQVRSACGILSQRLALDQAKRLQVALRVITFPPPSRTHGSAYAQETHPCHVPVEWFYCQG